MSWNQCFALKETSHGALNEFVQSLLRLQLIIIRFQVPDGTAGGAVFPGLKPALRSALRTMTVIGRVLLKGRNGGGALLLSQGRGSELKFKLDPGEHTLHLFTPFSGNPRVIGICLSFHSSVPSPHEPATALRGKSVGGSREEGNGGVGAHLCHMINRPYERIPRMLIRNTLIAVTRFIIQWRRL